MKKYYYNTITIKLPSKRLIISLLEMPLIKLEAFACRHRLIDIGESTLLDSLDAIQKHSNDNWSTRSHRRYWLADNIRRYSFREQANIL